MPNSPDSREQVLLVQIDRGDGNDAADLEEFQLLAESAGAELVGVAHGNVRGMPDPRFFIGSGKAEEIATQVADDSVDLVLCNADLSPSQERNLERVFKCRVLDRTGLILDIFAQRARSFEGKLQVELAQLQHLSTRLVRGWTHLERQKGGIGLRGPGETQLETDRRLLGHRITVLKRRLERVSLHRAQGRRHRARNRVPTVSLVGYTNAGKSTLFNRLTTASVLVADQLFATLDPTLRRIPLPNGAEAILADTVGFIQRLPHDLVAAFRSTLEESSSATLLLHLIDASSPERALRIEQVDEVLQEIGAGQVPQIRVYNKLDLLPDAQPRLERDADGRPREVWVSAHTGAGLDLLLEAIQIHLRPGARRHRVRLESGDGRLRARLFAEGHVLADRSRDDGGWELEIELPPADLERLLRQEQVLGERLQEGDSDPAGDRV